MIRIKDYILNENDISYIVGNTDDDRELKIQWKDNTSTYIKASFDDIEWNYGSQDSQDVASKYLVDRLKLLEDVYIKMQSSLNKLRDENRKLKEGSEE